ncbi:MAG: thiamine-phosphate kinase [Vicinamibacterales bacterium]
MTVSGLTERELVARIQRQLPPAPAWLVVGIGDDAAVVEPERNRLEVLTTDIVIDGVHVDRRFTPPDAIGHRALAANLSDLASMGAAPRAALLSLALPIDLSCDDFDAIVAGVATLAVRERVVVAGGNLTRTPGPLTIDIAVTGTVKRRSVLTRSGARPGDLVYVTGTIGAATAGLDMLRRALGADAAVSKGATTDSPCVERYFRPEPRVRAGLLLGRNRAATACIDLSDGLADGLARIAEASGVGIAVEAAAVPVDPSARAWFAATDVDALTAALTGGDDYELLLTVNPRHRRRLRAVVESGGVALTRIGTCTAGAGVMLHEAGQEPRPIPAGFSHFQ